MQILKGLHELYNFFQDQLNRPQTQKDSKHPKSIALFTYSLGFNQYNIKEDITLEAMANFCRLYEATSDIKPLFDKRFLTIHKNTLRFQGSSKANGFYCYKA